MRSSFLPCVSRLPEVGMWMKFFERWQSETDELRVVFDKPHGVALKEMVLSTQAEYLLFCEMDGIIFKEGVVDQYFRLLEHGTYDVIGSPRMSCSPQIADIAKKNFNLDYSGEGDKGPHFWPCFFFVKKSLLLQTDLDFNNNAWNVGDVLLGETLTEKVASDTMGWMSLQLRDLGAKVLEIPQYHCSPYDIDHYAQKTGIFNGKAPWIHIGSVSGDLTPPKSGTERLEMTRRLVWRDLCGNPPNTEFLSYTISEEYEEMKKIYKELFKI